MDLAEIEDAIESAIPGAEATVTQLRGPEDEDHLAATVVSPAFEGKSLVEQHEMVYDALGDRVTTDIHALEVRTEVP